MNPRTGLIIVAGCLALAGCSEKITAEYPPVATHAAANPGEAACVNAVNANSTGSGSTVISSVVSGPGTIVTVGASDGTTWECNVMPNAVIAELKMN